MSTVLNTQPEKAFQKQQIFLNPKALRKVTRERRWYKDIGLGFKTPTAAINGDYIGECKEMGAERRGEGVRDLERRETESPYEGSADRLSDVGQAAVVNLWRGKCLLTHTSSTFPLPFGRSTDKKCPWTGNVAIRGRILAGRVISTKMTRTVVLRREYLHYVPKYNRYEKRHKNLVAHCSPAFRVEVGDEVTVGEYLD